MITHLITAGGNRIELDLSDEGARRHFSWPGSNTDELLRQINDQKFYESVFRGRDNMLFIDIGANIGLVSIYAHDVCRRVFSVEPSDHFPLLVNMAKPFSNITPIQSALHVRNETVYLSLCDGNSTAHSTAVAVGGRTMPVTGQKLSIMLDAFAHNEGIDLIKVDVEGAELEALNDAEIARAREQVDTFYVESHPVAGMGYVQVRDIVADRFEHYGYETERWPSGTFIARRK